MNHELGYTVYGAAGERRQRSMTDLAIQIMRGTILLSGLIAIQGTALGQTPATMPDAQVEANVLKALAGAPELANETIRTTTVYGTVTLSGSVQSEALRTRAENLAANANGVKKVVDELALGSSTASASTGQAMPPEAAAGDQGGSQPLLQSDGTYAPATGSAQAQNQPQDQPPAGQAPPPDQMQSNPQMQPPQQANGDPGAPPPPYGRRPMAGQPYPYGAPPAGYNEAPPPYGGQQAGIPVTIPANTLLRIRVNQRLSSNHSQPGTTFDGIVVNDVVAGGAVAIPRGAAVQGKVVDAKASGVLKGRGELSIQLTQVILAGKPYPLATDLWAHNGSDKTLETVNKTAGFGAVGALLGAAAGGGVGAAVGGGIGAAAGLGSSATSGGGQVIIPSEGIVTFHLAQETAVTTVSEQEMQRLAYGVPNGAQPTYYRRRGYYGPVYYPGAPGYYPPPY